MDGVGGGVISHAEVHRSADVPEPDVVAAADGTGGHARPHRWDGYSAWL